ncbi:hypothetical protein PR048_029489 [Dryococelus australis]|uniref:Uncharacterized protein n=1 Tax=Dryococelus australis TaxID=614101 RepID=A0ABQ9GE66_9NEOP|nr:hypothetical protein PR048_029489 [Dryococelus australis]
MKGVEVGGERGRETSPTSSRTSGQPLPGNAFRKVPFPVCSRFSSSFRRLLPWRAVFPADVVLKRSSANYAVPLLQRKLRTAPLPASVSYEIAKPRSSAAWSWRSMASFSSSAHVPNTDSNHRSPTELVEITWSTVAYTPGPALQWPILVRRLGIHVPDRWLVEWVLASGLVLWLLHPLLGTLNKNVSTDTEHNYFLSHTEEPGVRRRSDGSNSRQSSRVQRCEFLGGSCLMKQQATRWDRHFTSLGRYSLSAGVDRPLVRDLGHLVGCQLACGGVSELTRRQHPQAFTKQNRCAIRCTDFRSWESCLTMQLVGGFSRGYPFSPRPCSNLISPSSAPKTPPTRRLNGFAEIHVSEKGRGFTSMQQPMEKRRRLSIETSIVIFWDHHSLHLIQMKCKVDCSRQKGSYSWKAQFSAYRSRRLCFTTLNPFRPTLIYGFNCCIGATVAERLACSPPTKAIRVQSPAGSLRIFACGNRARTMPLVGGFSRGSPVSPPLHSGAAPYSPQSPSSDLKTSMMEVEDRRWFVRATGCSCTRIEHATSRSGENEGAHPPISGCPLLIMSGLVASLTLISRRNRSCPPTAPDTAGSGRGPRA